MTNPTSKDSEGPDTMYNDTLPPAPRGCRERLRPPLSSPTLRTQHDQDNITLILTWNTAQYRDCPGIRYIVEMERDGNFVTFAEVEEADVQVKDVARGKLYQFRYRVRGASGPPSLPSPVATTFIGYPDEPDPPLDIAVHSMMVYQSTYVSTTQEIGIGAFANVMLVKDQKDQLYAAKNIHMRRIKNTKHEYDEFNIMRRLRHDRVVSLFGAYADDKNMIIITEYLSGGELFERIVEQQQHGAGIGERECALFVRQLCEGAAYLHHQRVAHLDLKPENVVCTRPHSDNIKIIDFGLAKLIEPHATKICCLYGTKDYVAPEVLKFEPISFETDMWSLGVITYVLLSGLFPFAGETWTERCVNIERCSYNFEEDVFTTVSQDAKDFISMLLVGAPRLRPAAAACLQHPWLAAPPPPAPTAMLQTRENMINYLNKYRTKWQKARNVLRAASRLRTGATSTATAATAAALDERRRAFSPTPALHESCTPSA